MQATIPVNQPGAPHAAGRPAAACDLELAVALYDVVRGLRRLPVDERIDVIDAHLLVRLQDAGSARASDLVAGTGLDLSTISRRMTRLEHSQLVVREPDPADARAHRLVLSDDGAKVLAAALAHRADVLHRALADWDVETRTALAALLRRLADDIASSLENS